MPSSAGCDSGGMGEAGIRVHRGEATIISASGLANGWSGKYYTGDSACPVVATQAPHADPRPDRHQAVRPYGPSRM
jgi:hypothetical protein